jgi:hypothetical protein
LAAGLALDLPHIELSLTCDALAATGGVSERGAEAVIRAARAGNVGAISALGELADHAAEAALTLEPMLDSPTTRSRAAGSLARLGHKSGVDVLRAQIRDERAALDGAADPLGFDSLRLVSTLDQVERAGPLARPVWKQVVPLLSQQDPLLHMTAARALASIGADEPEVVEALHGLLSDPEVGDAAARALLVLTDCDAAADEMRERLNAASDEVDSLLPEGRDSGWFEPEAIDEAVLPITSAAALGASGEPLLGDLDSLASTGLIEVRLPAAWSAARIRLAIAKE